MRLTQNYQGFMALLLTQPSAYKPEHKGKVERSIRIVKEQLIAG